MARKIFASVILILFLCFVSLPAYAKSGKDILNSLKGEANKLLKKSASSSKKSSSPAPQKNNTPAPSANNTNSQPQTLSDKAGQELINIGMEIEEDLCKLGDSILAYNKPALEVKLTREERLIPEEYYDPSSRKVLSPTMYTRVCVKGKTIVIGNAEKDRKFTTTMIITGEPGFPPDAGSIKAGADVSVIERRIGLTAQKISELQSSNPGIINADPTSFVFCNVAYKDGKITELEHHNGYEIFPEKAWNFVEKKAEEIGFVLWFAL